MDCGPLAEAAGERREPLVPAASRRAHDGKWPASFCLQLHAARERMRRGEPRPCAASVRVSTHVRCLSGGDFGQIGQRMRGEEKMKRMKMS